MAEEVRSGVEHVAALDFDLTGIEEQFAKLGRMVEEQGQVLADRFSKSAQLKVDISADDVKFESETNKVQEKLDEVLADFARSAGRGTKKVAAEIESDLLELLNDGFSTVMHVTTEQKAKLEKELGKFDFGNKLKWDVIDTTKMSAAERAFAERQASKASGFDRYSMDFEGVDGSSSAYTRVMDRLLEQEDKFTAKAPEFMEYLQAQYKLLIMLKNLRAGETLGDETGFGGVHLYDNEATTKSMNALEKLRDVLNAMTDQQMKLNAQTRDYANATHEVERNAAFQSGKGGFSADAFTAWAENAAKAAGMVAKVETTADAAGQVVSGAVTYTDRWGNTFKETYGWAKETEDATEEVFKVLRQNTASKPLDGAAKQFKETAAEARSFATEYAQVKRQLESAELYGAKTGDEDMQGQARAALADMEKLNTQMRVNNGYLEQAGERALKITAQDKQQLDDASLLGIRLTEQVRQRKLAAAEAEQAAKAEKANASALEEQKKKAQQVAAMYRQLLALEKQQAGINGVSADDLETTRVLKEQLAEMLKQIDAEGRLDKVSKETLETYKSQLGVLQANARQTSIEKGSKPLTEGSDDGLLARAGKWFGAYKLYHLVEQGVRGTVDAVISAEDRMAEISRVMNDGSYDADNYRESLYKLGEQYGQTFDDTAQVAAEWARAGYDAADSLEAARVTLLALATADLEAGTATTDLISVCNQWGIEMADMEGLLDRVNMASDRYPVSAQNLMDALSKVGAAAKNAGMSLNETIGLITAMTKSSGASGDAVGNALKSMIAITDKGRNLNKLSGMGVKVYADEGTGTLRNYLDILESIKEVWEQSNAEKKAALEAQMVEMGLVNEGMAEMIGQQDVYNEHLTATTEQQQKLVEATANSYRSNFIQAILSGDNLEKVRKIATDLENADGWSRNEVQVYLDTLTAKLNTLKTSLEELAVTSIENGSADLAKDFLDMANDVVQLTGKLGGLKLVLLGAFDVTVLAKAAKINSAIDLMAGNIKKFKVEYAVAAAQFGNVSALRGMAEQFKLAIGPAGYITLAITAVYGLAQAFDWMQNRAANAHKEILAAANGYDELAAKNGSEWMEQQQRLDSIVSRYKEYTEAVRDGREIEGGYTQKVKELQEELNELLGDQAGAIDLINGKYEDVLKNVAGIQDAAYEARKFELETAADEAKSQNNAGIQSAGLRGNNLGSAALYKLQNINGGLYKKILSAEPTRENQSKLDAELSFVTEKLKEMKDAGGKTSTVFKLFKQIQSDMTVALEANNAAIEKAEGLTRSDGEVKKKNAKDTEELTQAEKNFWESLSDKQAKAAVEASSFSSNLNGLNSALADVNLGNELSLDTMMSLVDVYPELAGAIENENGVLSLNADALETVRQAQYARMVAEQMAVIAAAEDANWTAAQKEECVRLTNALFAASDATARQAANTAILSWAAKNATGDIQSESAAVAKLNIIMGMSNTAAENLAKSGTSAATKASNAAQDAAKAQAEAYKAQKKAADEAFDAQTKQVEAAKKAYDEEADARVKALEKEKDAAEKSYQAQIDALNKLKTANSRADSEEDYAEKRADLVAQYEETRKRSSQDAVKEGDDLLKQIAELDKEHGRTLRDNAIEDKISELEDEKNAVAESYDAQVEAIKEAKAAQDDYYDGMKTQISEAKAAQDKYYEGLIEAANTAASAAAESAAAGAASAVGSTNSAAKHMSGTMTEVAKYMQSVMGGSLTSYEKFLMNMKARGDNWANYTMRQLGQMYSAWYNLRKLQTQQILDNRPQDYYDNLAEAEKYKEKLMGNFPSSHSGSTVVKEGLVNVAPGEIILESMASKALAEIAAPMRRVFLQPHLVEGLERIVRREEMIARAAAPSTAQQRVEFNYTVQEQNFNDNADSDLALQKLTRAVKRAMR